MEVLVTGCERSGTKMLAQYLEHDYEANFMLENKHTIGSFRYWQECQRWVKYQGVIVPTPYTTLHEKHSLNRDVNIDFLKWVKMAFPNVQIHYIVRNGFDVVGSMMAKEWGYSMTQDNYRMGLFEAMKRWCEIIEQTWDWAQQNADKIWRYEEESDIISNPLPENTKRQLMNVERFANNMKRTGYGN